MKVVSPRLKRGSMSERIDIAKAVRNAEHGITGKRFCTSCQTMRPAEYGKMLIGKVNRWQCTACSERRSRAPYARHKGEGDA
jgi:hypothetical protein